MHPILEEWLDKLAGTEIPASSGDSGDQIAFKIDSTAKQIQRNPPRTIDEVPPTTTIESILVCFPGVCIGIKNFRRLKALAVSITSQEVYKLGLCNEEFSEAINKVLQRGSVCTCCVVEDCLCFKIGPTCTLYLTSFELLDRLQGFCALVQQLRQEFEDRIVQVARTRAADATPGTSPLPITPPQLYQGRCDQENTAWTPQDAASVMTKLDLIMSRVEGLSRQMNVVVEHIRRCERIDGMLDCSAPTDYQRRDTSEELHDRADLNIPIPWEVRHCGAPTDYQRRDASEEFNDLTELDMPMPRKVNHTQYTSHAIQP